MAQTTPLARVLRRYIDEKGSIPERLAEESGVDKRTLNHWLRGRARRPQTWHPLAKMAAALNLSKAQANELFEAADYPGIDELIRAEPDNVVLLARWLVRVVNNLPRQATNFFGRAEEIARLTRELSARELITLVGPGGCGKTRLALELAETVVHTFRDGVYLVELAAISDPSMVLPTVAGALAIAEVPGERIEDRLAAELREREMLLILDNFEQVDTAASRVAALVKATRRLKVLVTSRAILHISVEQVFPVEPLAPPARADTPEVLATNPAVALFCDRARLADPGFVLTSENAPAVATLCSRLDGLPLAIELAAARCGRYAPQTLLERFPSRLALGRDGPVDVDPRQRTLRATIAWSYDLLRSDEQVLFARLGVFVGGCGEAAADAACELGEDETMDVRSGMESLVENSLLRAWTGADGQLRYAMLETIREYALERLEGSGEAETVRGRHAEHFLALTEEVETELKGLWRAVWVDRLESEHDNLRAALGWMLRNAPEAGLRLAGALWTFWYDRGYLSEGRRWLEGMLEKTHGAPAVVRVKALNAAGVLAREQGDYARSTELHDEGLRLSEELGDTLSIATSLSRLGNVARYERDYERAAALHYRSLALYRELGDDPGIAVALGNLGIVEENRGRLEEAKALHEESLALARRMGDRSGEAHSLLNLGNVIRNKGDYARAATLYEGSLGLCRELGDRRSEALSLLNLSDLALIRGDYEQAVPLLEQSSNVCREIGDKHNQTITLLNLGNVWLARGDGDRAAPYIWESLKLCRELGDDDKIAYCLEAAAGISQAHGEGTRAVRLWGAAAALRGDGAASLPPFERSLYDRYLAAARGPLDGEAFASAWSEGEAMPLERAITHALKTLAPP